jgi:hypothetical protein
MAEARGEISNNEPTIKLKASTQKQMSRFILNISFMKASGDLSGLTDSTSLG